LKKKAARAKQGSNIKDFVKRLKVSDTLYIENIDRLSRDYDGIIDQWHILTKQKGVTVKVLDTPMLDTDQVEGDLLNKFMRDMLLRVQAFQAESEWQKIKNRQAQGIAAAKASGKQFGRPKVARTEAEIEIAKQYLSHEIALDTALNLLAIKKSTFYNWCQKVNK